MITFPKEFITLLQSSLPSEKCQCVINAFEQPPVTSVRLNSLKPYFELLNVPQNTLPIPWETNAFCLTERPSFVSDPLFHAGAYYVQESSSMIIGYLIKLLLNDLKDPALILDLCAAPGGKSTHILQNKRTQDLLIVNEVIKSRAHILSENIKKWGSTDQCIISLDSSVIGKSESLFQIMVGDLPCSGEGLFRKDSKAIAEWSIHHVNLCKQRQRRIVADVWPSLTSNGYFIYSTCTFNRRENEENIQWICKELGAETVSFSFPEHWNILEEESGCYRMLPGMVSGEGFFFSVLRKTSGKEKTREVKKSKISFIIKKPDQEIARYLSHTLSLLNYNESSCLVQENVIELYLKFFQCFQQPLSFGLFPGIYQKNKFKPSAEFILSNSFNNSLSSFHATDEQALAFLSRDPLRLELQEGIFVWNYQRIPIGYFIIKHNRVQHGWPMEWRIRNKPNIKEVYNNQQKLSLFL